MNGTAHISFPGGGTILPAATPYERQIVFEHFESSAKQHADVCLSVKGCSWTVNVALAHRALCASCLVRLHDRAYRRAGRNFCTRCTRGALQ